VGRLSATLFVTTQTIQTSNSRVTRLCSLIVKFLSVIIVSIRAPLSFGYQLQSLLTQYRHAYRKAKTTYHKFPHPSPHGDATSMVTLHEGGLSGGKDCSLVRIAQNLDP
jgi:hypothetical protein